MPIVTRSESEKDFQYVVQRMHLEHVDVPDGCL